MKSNKVKILHVFGGLNIGGAETMLMNLYRNIDKDKFEFDFVIHTKKHQYYEEEIKQLGGKIYYVPQYKGYNHFLYKKAWNDFFKKHKEYKIIHGHVRSTASIYLKIAKKYGLKTISHSHSISNGVRISSIIKTILQYKIRYIADYFLGCSIESCKWLFGEKITNSDKCFIINNAIDTKKFVFNPKKREEIREKLGLTNKFVIGQVGRFIEIKNHLFSIKLFKKYHDKYHDTILLLVGNGPLEVKIKEYINKLDLEDSVIILKDRNDVCDLMQGMDVFIMPSFYEGLPLTLVEAQSSSLPCVVSNKISAGFLIDELIKKLDLNMSFDEWIQAINKSQNNVRINREKEIVEAGFDIEKNVEWLEKFYLNILEK